MLQSMGLQRVRHDLVTEQQQPKMRGSESTSQQTLVPTTEHLIYDPLLPSGSHL